MTSSTPDFRKTHFPHPDLDRVHGQPSIDQIDKIFRQLKQNAASVRTNLGGGQHGFLPLVLTNQQWTSIPNTQEFVRPTNPGPFQPPQNRPTNSEIALAKSRWETRLQNYINCQHLEATLKNQLENAFDYDILDGLRNRVSNTITDPIPTVIKYLFEEYGELSPDELVQKEDEVKNYSYDTALPVSNVFNEILHLQDLHELTGSTLAEDTMIRLGYIILNRTQVFKESLIAWNNKQPNDKTWNNFQSHFRKAYRDLKKVRALNIQNSTIAHATIIDQIKQHNTQTMQQISDALKTSIYDTVNLMSSEQEPKSMQANNTIQSLQNEIRELRDTIAQLKKPQAKQQSRRKPRKYCWTHGWCAHSGMDCNSKAEGHKEEATLENKMGGSTKNCVTK